MALKDRIGPKLRAESNASGGAHAKAKVDVYRGASYRSRHIFEEQSFPCHTGAGWQCAYFFRKTAQKHSVLLKVNLNRTCCQCI